MAVLCPSCDAEPDGAVAGSVCAACGANLVAVIEPVDDVIGTTIDHRFEVVARLGAGAMGTVYRAIQKSIGREVALKLIDQRYARDVAAVKRFFREAQLASKLAHPNTVGVIEFGQDPRGTLYLAMELVRGKTLHELVERDGALSLARIVRIGTQLCDALEAAHELAIVHRDLKLENVMLLDGGRDLVKVLDFGLARSLADPRMHQTTEGIISGSPRYMAPELALDAATPMPTHDLYSLGVTLAELAVGGPVWSSPTLEGLFSSKLDTGPVLAQVPDVLRPLLGRLLAPYGPRPDAGEVRTELAALDVSRNTTTPPATKLAIDPTLPLRLELSPPTGEMMPLDRLELVAIDGSVLDEPPPVTPATSAPPPPAAPPKLELDPDWVQKRVSQQRAPYKPPPAAPPSKRRANLGMLLAGLVVIGAGVGAVIYLQPKATPQGPGVEIVITAPSPTPVTIDGKAAGKTPLRLQRPRGAKPIAIRVGKIIRQVVPDHDQLVDVADP